jgi:hypothetical protein
MMPANPVSTAAAMGVTMAAMGRRVGSEPVSTTGNVMLRIVASSQTAVVATVSPIQIGRRDALPRNLPIAHRNPPVATKPHSHVAKAATGRCSARDQVRGKETYQHHRNPDRGEPGHAPHHPRTIGHCCAFIRTRGLHLPLVPSLRVNRPNDGQCERNDPAYLTPSTHRSRVASGNPPPGGARRSHGRRRRRHVEPQAHGVTTPRPSSACGAPIERRGVAYRVAPAGQPPPARQATWTLRSRC